MDVFEIVVTAPKWNLLHTWMRILGDMLVTLTGGYSAYEGQGGWRSENGEVILEPHIRLIAYCKDISAFEIFNCMAPTIRQYKENCQQEVILVILNGEPMLLKEIPEALFPV